MEGRLHHPKFLKFVAKRTIDDFLKDNEMEVYLSTFGV